MGFDRAQQAGEAIDRSEELALPGLQATAGAEGWLGAMGQGPETRVETARSGRCVAVGA